MIKRILVPTDGSQPSERAAEQAIDLAKQFDAGLHSVFVVSDPRVGFTPYESDLEPLFQSGKEFVSRICEMAEESGISCETDVFEADQLHQGILSYAKEHDIDWIVMGAHGESAALPDFFLGSVTERVLKASSVPVLVVPAVD